MAKSRTYGKYNYITNFDTTLAGIDDSAAYIDDIVNGGTTVEKHIENINKGFKKLREYNFHIKFIKYKFFTKEIKYLGSIISVNGLRPDPDKIETVLNLPAPKDVSELRSFLGSINYYGKYIHQMDNLRAPLDNLLKSKTKFERNSACQKAFKKFKTLLQSDLLFNTFQSVTANQACSRCIR